MFQQAHELGMFTVLWCYLRNSAFKTKEADYHTAADLTAAAVPGGAAFSVLMTVHLPRAARRQPCAHRGARSRRTRRPD